MAEYSIIIPAYNAEKTISVCLNSVVNQIDFSEKFEVIVIDDGSTDNTLQIIENYALKYSNFRVITQKNRGVSVARNTGLDNSNGKYIIFLDSDDSLDSSALTNALLDAKSGTYDIYIYAYNSSEYGTLKIDISREELIDDILQQKNKKILTKINTPWAKIYLSEIIKKNKIRFCEDVKIGEDLLFNLEYFLYCSTGAFFCKNFYNYTIAENSSSRNIDSYYINNNLCFFKRIKKLLISHNILDKYIDQVNLFVLNSLKIYSKNFIFLNKNRQYERMLLDQICSLDEYKKAIQWLKVKGNKKKVILKDYIYLKLVIKHRLLLLRLISWKIFKKKN